MFLFKLIGAGILLYFNFSLNPDGFIGLAIFGLYGVSILTPFSNFRT